VIVLNEPHHGRRGILHFNVTRHPTAEWLVQQLREAFPEDGQHRYVIFDRDSTFNNEVVTFLKATELEPKRTSLQAPATSHPSLRDSSLPWSQQRHARP
jgi:hypothetical protein